MRNLIDRQLAILILVGLLLTSISYTGVTSQLSLQLVGYTKGLTDLFPNINHEIVNLGDSIGHLSSLSYENDTLRQELAKLHTQYDQQAAELEKSQYISANQVKNSVVDVLNPASTLANGYIYIAAGSNQSVAQDDLIVQGNFLIGIVEQVSFDYSKVKIVTANDLPLAVDIKGKLGITVGLANIAIKIKDIDATADIVVGDEVKLIPSKDNPLLGKYKLGKVSKIESENFAKTKVVQIDYPIIIADLKFAELIKHK